MNAIYKTINWNTNYLNLQYTSRLTLWLTLSPFLAFIFLIELLQYDLVSKPEQKHR